MNDPVIQTAALKDEDKPIFLVNALPAKYGDSLWVTYGTKGQPHHLLIDGGTASAADHIRALIQELPEAQRVIELLVVTHVDSDHIWGILKILLEKSLPAKINQVWFNAYKHLAPKEEAERLGAVMGDKLSTAIDAHQLPWNNAFGGNAVVIPEDPEQPLPVIHLSGGMKLTLLSPTPAKLADFKDQWEKEIEKARLKAALKDTAPEEKAPEGLEKLGADTATIETLNQLGYDSDSSKGNGTSIAFLAEFAGKTVLFSGDAHPTLVWSSLNRYSKEKVKINLLKVSHHGSTGNTGFELVEKIDCRHYLVSTNHQQHPTMQTIAYIVMRGTANPTIYFNYATQQHKAWESVISKGKYVYQTKYPDDEGIIVDVMALPD
jgi:beta-lactamase superfamily II metal-dependent hydrolase